MTDIKWPAGTQTRTAEEWNGLAADWQNPESRAIIMDSLKALGVPASEYVRKQPPQRAEYLIELQEKAKPGSTKAGGKAAAATTTTKAPAATTKKAASTTKPAAATNSGETQGGGGGGTVDLTPVLEELAAARAEVATLAATVEEMARLNKQCFVALRILVLSNPEAAALLDDGDVVKEFAESNLSSVFDEGNAG